MKKLFFTLMLMLMAALPSSAQGVIKISALPSGGAVGSGDLFVDVQSGVTSSVTGAQMQTWAQTGAVLTAGSYSNPSWITGLAWSKLSSTPTTLSGYGITDPIVLTSGSYANPSWFTSLAWSKLTGTPTTLSGYGIADALAAANNLSDVASASTARTNLGLGTLATFSPTGTADGSHVLTGADTWVSLPGGYTLPPATSSALGGVIPSATYFAVDGSGNLTITAAPWSLVTGTPTTLSGYGITDPIVLTSGSYSNPSWITALAWSKISSAPTTLSGYGITDPIVLTSGSYSNPSWITGLAWSKITGAPTTLSGYGITDPIVLTSGSYSNPSWITTLAWSKITGAPAAGGSWTQVVTNTTLTSGENAWLDAAHGSLTATLPASPSNGDTIMVADFWGNSPTSTGFASSPQTINGGGHLIVTPSSAGASSMTLAKDYEYAVFTYQNGPGSWMMTDLSPPSRVSGTLASGVAHFTNDAITTSSVITACHMGTSASNAGALYLTALTSGGCTITSSNSSDNDTITILIQ